MAREFVQHAGWLYLGGLKSIATETAALLRSKSGLTLPERLPAAS